MDPVAAPADLLPILAANQSRALALLQALIDIDSGSRFAAGVNRVADLCAARLAQSGWSVERLAPPAGHDAGDVVIGRLRGALDREHGGRRVLLSAHMDTVFATGTVASRPFTVTDGIATGPGVIDDKCGIVAAIEAVDALVHGAGWDAFEEVVLVLSCDEELGSPVSGPILTREAAHADVGFGLEAARRTGDLVSARKGVAEVTVHVEGRAAHAGVEPHKGVHALLEAAHLVIAIQGLNGRWPDVSLNVGRLTGGGATNVVPADAALTIEVRGFETALMETAMEAIEALADEPTVAGAGVSVQRGHAMPPMETTPATVALAEEAGAIAHALGFRAGHTRTGGGADASLIAAVGVPALDGLGPIGGNPHTPEEYLEIESMVPRTALLAALIARRGRA